MTKIIQKLYLSTSARATYAMPQPPYYFAITPNFVTSSMKSNFQETTIVMMGCEGINNTKMAEAFIERGARVYIGWDGSILDPETTRLSHVYFSI